MVEAHKVETAEERATRVAANPHLLGDELK